MNNIQDFQKVADIFKQLSDTSRLRIFFLLCHSEECVIDIANMMGMSMPAVAHHLKQLKSSGIIVSRRDGKEVYYKAAETVSADLLHETIEQVMSIVCPEFNNKATNAYQSEQIELINSMHDYMMQNIDKRITIDELSDMFHINPTTLKRTFKAVYGNSIAYHIKEHRMKKAMELLKTTNMSISEISAAVGYENQSKFTSAFKNFYNILPREFRKN